MVTINKNAISSPNKYRDKDFILENCSHIERCIDKIFDKGIYVRYGTISLTAAITIISYGKLTYDSYNSRLKYSAIKKDFSMPLIINPFSVVKFGATHLMPIEDVYLPLNKICGTNVYDATVLNDFYAAKVVMENLKQHCFVPKIGDLMFSDYDNTKCLACAIYIISQGDYSVS